MAVSDAGRESSPASIRRMGGGEEERTLTAPRRYRLGRSSRWRSQGNRGSRWMDCKAWWMWHWPRPTRPPRSLRICEYKAALSSEVQRETCRAAHPYMFCYVHRKTWGAARPGDRHFMPISEIEGGLPPIFNFEGRFKSKGGILAGFKGCQCQNGQSRG